MASAATNDAIAENETVRATPAQFAGSFLKDAHGLGLKAGHNIEFGAEPEEAEGQAARRKALTERWVAPFAALTPPSSR